MRRPSRSAYAAAVDIVRPHHQGVLVVVDVVVATYAGGSEAEPPVQVLRTAVGQTHLERQVLDGSCHAAAGQLQQHPGGDALSVPPGVHGDVGDVPVVVGDHQAGVADHSGTDAGHEVDPAVGQRELADEQAERPRPGVDLILDPQHRTEVAAAHRCQHDDLTGRRLVVWSSGAGGPWSRRATITCRSLSTS